MSTEKRPLGNPQSSNTDTNSNQPQPRPQPQSTLSSTSTTTPSTTKTPVTLSPDSHLDPSAYVRGTHRIKIDNNVLIHPRAHLITIHSPLTINSDSIITERSIIGGPIPNPTPNSNPDSNTTITSTSTSATTSPTPSSNPTTIGSKVHIHPNVQIHSGATIGSHSIIESNVTILHDITIGQHVKICAGSTISRNVPDWTVVYGINGEFRRRRKPPSSNSQTLGSSNAGKGDVPSDPPSQVGSDADADGNVDIDMIENARLKTMAAEREATTTILKKSAAKAVVARTKR